MVLWCSSLGDQQKFVRIKTIHWFCLISAQHARKGIKSDINSCCNVGIKLGTPDLLTFLVNLPLSKSGYIICHRSPVHKGLFWPSFCHPFHWRAIQTCLLSLPRNLGVALLLLDIYCGNRSRLLCARTPHKIRVRLVRPDLVLLIEVSKVVLYLRCIKCHVNYRVWPQDAHRKRNNGQNGPC